MTLQTNRRTSLANSKGGDALSRGRSMVRKLVVAFAGGILVATGIGMVFLPGPALLVIPLGLAILSIEFAWARRLLRRLKKRSNAPLASPKSGNDDPTHPPHPPYPP